jgi:hypothetical protein
MSGERISATAPAGPVLASVNKNFVPLFAARGPVPVDPVVPVPETSHENPVVGEAIQQACSTSAVVAVNPSKSWKCGASIGPQVV